MSQSHLECLFELALRLCGRDLPPAEREYYFAPGRRYRADWAWPAEKLAVEIQGACYLTRKLANGKVVPVGRHNTDGDREKMNLYAALGWRVIQFSGSMLKQRPSVCVETVRRALKGE